jgi:hypothetical protein
VPATSSVVAASASTICYYSDFWCTIRDFQTLASATVALASVIGAIFGILLKARLDRRSDERKSRSSRSQTAASMCALIAAEREYFPQTNLFRLARDVDVNGILGGSDRVAMAIEHYIDYFTKFVSTLSHFPSPISDRAGFMAWISARLAFSLSALRAASPERRDVLIAERTTEIRLLVAAAIGTIGAIYTELDSYRNAPAAYEKHWRKDRSTFDVREFKAEVERALRQMDAEDALMRELKNRNHTDIPDTSRSV